MTIFYHIWENFSHYFFNIFSVPLSVSSLSGTPITHMLDILEIIFLCSLGEIIPINLSPSVFFFLSAMKYSQSLFKKISDTILLHSRILFLLHNFHSSAEDDSISKQNFAICFLSFQNACGFPSNLDHINNSQFQTLVYRLQHLDHFVSVSLDFLFISK